MFIYLSAASILTILQSTILFLLTIAGCYKKQQQPSPMVRSPQAVQQTTPPPPAPAQPSAAAAVAATTDALKEDKTQASETGDSLKPEAGGKEEKVPSRQVEAPEDSFDALKPRTLEAARAKDIKDEKVKNRGDYKTLAEKLSEMEELDKTDKLEPNKKETSKVNK